MNEVTLLLSRLEAGDHTAWDRLLPLLYDELHGIAAQLMVHERKGHTLQSTALVHEAYLRLVGSNQRQHWDSRGHFFAAAAEAMRRILIESARRKSRAKHGGNHERVELDDALLASEQEGEKLLALNEALDQLAVEMPDKAELVKLRYFAGFTIDEAAKVLGISRATAKRHWAVARAWLFNEIGEGDLDEREAKNKASQ